mmetsp:Transcript_3523/g.10231  ORF Transcript_3523/g.10231 Transcript_3523/m.10231 type:complete len:389 (+) Transcript_3523:375-1541(+)|eukprot:CAMPEP_0206148756 /NCGR_PEP_ID=MMETSP1473-20131121/37420_1 /ASSEMBLY_ACC=CAM_ASM_001109 /TAXON_ID=1461547 /ORGANISM="Stichococcus sp, Strain RCC1054" /LENGTH=388 /DNA_ID=CAMNT_0053546179 /DNA_START=316 /DNA_END=1482 /DNA_ORIENTATION=+
MGEDAWSKLRKFDAFGKIDDAFVTPSMAGGFISLTAYFIMLLLFIGEFRLFLTVRTENQLTVDTTRGEKLQINLDVTFPGLPCGWLSLDAMDVSGELELDVDHDITKRRLSSSGVPLDDGEKHEMGPKTDNSTMHTNGTVCGDCYGAQEREGQCCNTCNDVREAYRKRGWGFNNPAGIAQCEKEGFLKKLLEQQGEGCHIYGFLKVNKVAGNFHFAPGKSFQQGSMHVHDLVPFPTKDFDVSHTINQLSFGEPFPGRKSPLDGVVKGRPRKGMATVGTGMHQYFLKVVPTLYTDLRKRTISTNQFSVTEYFKASDHSLGQNSLPGAFFFFDLSPIKVRLTEEKLSFASFMTSACAIIGGVFTVSGLIDSFVYHGGQVIRKKQELGKLS